MQITRQILKLILDQFQHATFISDTNGIIICANEFFFQYMGFENVSDQSINDQFPKLCFACLEIQNTWKSIPTNDTWSGNLCYKTKNGKVLFEQTRIVPFANPEQEETYYMCSIDYSSNETSVHSASKNTSDPFDSISKQKKDFLSVTTHQFKNSFSVIMANLEMLEDWISISEPIYANIRPTTFIERCKQETLTMQNNVNRLLEYDRIQTGYNSTEAIPVDIVQVCQSLCSKYSSILPNHCEVAFNIQGLPKCIMLPLRPFDNAIANLLSNACKYSKDQPCPRLDIFFEDTTIIIKIRDFGIGIPEDEIEHIFTPFYRCSNAVNYEGTGLGLNIVQNYIEKCNGSIEVKSKINEGTEFCITFRDVRYSENINRDYSRKK